MFARTSRLLLRPSWAEDAGMVASTIADRALCRALLTRQGDPILPPLLIFERTDGAPRLIGACGLRTSRAGTAEPHIWIAPVHRGRGFAAEVAPALIDIGRTLGFGVEQPAAGKKAAPVEIARCDPPRSLEPLAA